ncbi:DUF2474 domain-containing protein [Aliirhizobium cellulosilyticum]|uniref:DUF2474 domain-containing protein n=1 Tax=Aliirhizobium cellulosilyticum TaxID=393664 RepID=A0A7W6THF1_9HYPH|nr:DUF2474 domain-containing protein [Rhizobium cellulosilyticum]MBB4349348.1 hypothetical protein [Rhizobium cellulosilyticum]MBB4412430.1 hypothetical protein [Rhizobium cellulosilyticum]MBB4447062.1 hypothetical protein [Rhizobium cellulosilyticum]
MTSKTQSYEPLRRVGWMIAIWVLSVVCLGVFAMAFRFLMSLAGLTS